MGPIISSAPPRVTGFRQKLLRGAQLIYHWLASLIRFPVGRGAYLALYPPLFDSAAVYSRTSGRFLKFALRPQSTDAFSFVSVFLNEDYKVRSEVHAAQIESIYSQMLQDDLRPLIVDCGANNGMSAAYFSDNYRGAEIAAVEPHLGNLKLARQNTVGRNVTLVEAAVACSPGMFEIKESSSDHNAFQVQPAGDGNTVGLTIDEIVNQFGQDKATTPFLIKIDIEGFESDLFSNNTDWINDFTCLIIELHDYLAPGRSISNSFVRAIAPLNRDFLVNGDVVASVSNDFTSDKS